MNYCQLSQQLHELYRHEKGERFFTFSLLWATLAQKHGFSPSLRFFSQPCPPAQEEALLQDTRRLLGGYPLQYYLGVWEFRGRDYLCEEQVLIPREDTALLCELCQELLPQGGTFADVCCGSGIVGIDLLLHRPDARGLAVDLSPHACSLTEKNARLHGVLPRLTVTQGDLFSSAIKRLLEKEKVSLFACNPPYIPTKDLQGLDSNVQQEPVLALDGGEDGLCFYRHVLSLACDFPSVVFACEIGYDQREALEELLLSHGKKAQFFRDRSGNDRCFVLR